jgi:hypothetical protein
VNEIHAEIIRPHPKSHPDSRIEKTTGPPTKSSQSHTQVTKNDPGIITLSSASEQKHIRNSTTLVQKVIWKSPGGQNCENIRNTKAKWGIRGVPSLPEVIQKSSAGDQKLSASHQIVIRK